jgi:uncharacterized protein YkwD
MGARILIWLFVSCWPVAIGLSRVSAEGPMSKVASRTPAPTIAARPAAPKADISREILFFVNEFRRKKGLPALEANSYISSVALGHSRDMLTGKSPFGHDGFRKRIDLISGWLGKLEVAAENVASGPMDAREVVDGWLHSPGHRRNILGDFQLTGIGVAEARNGMIYFTQIFVK